MHLAKNSSLEDLMMTALEGRGHFPIRRIGICAGEFEERARGGIKSFFAQDISVRPGSGKREASREEKAIARTNTQPQENSRQHSSVPLDSRSSKDINDQFDADLAFAQKLQSSFDREDRLLSILDSKNGKSRETECNTPKSHKKVKIEQFFTAKRK